MWLATAGDGHGPHLIPVSYWWDGFRIITATPEKSRTMKNLRTQPKVRLSIGATTDVLMIDAVAEAVPAVELAEEALDGYAGASGLPRSSPGYGYIQLTPERIQVWRGPAEFTGRTVMRAGAWLNEPVD